ncbi:unnamed protein product [Mycena citricolor]|uniref:Uncharacterized protein n=1 Tax=Mycena citricolor TaxID=2018698 RepID=A0AAD2HFA3_9AGAR|nr:unnamed protein product [Mycena citricolor]
MCANSETREEFFHARFPPRPGAPLGKLDKSLGCIREDLYLNPNHVFSFPHSRPPQTIIMFVARLARTPALRQIHTTARLRSGHGDYNHLPFVAPYQGAAKLPFGAKMVAFLSLGFAIPFIAVEITHAKKA